MQQVLQSLTPEKMQHLFLQFSFQRDHKITQVSKETLLWKQPGEFRIIFPLSVKKDVPELLLPPYIEWYGEGGGGNFDIKQLFMEQLY